MAQCKATIDPIPCKTITGHYRDDYCARHRTQYQASRHFYKDVEAEWERARWNAFSNPGSPDSKQEGLRLLVTVINAREGHTDWFFGGEPEPNHKDHESQLWSDYYLLRREIFSMEYGIVTNMSDGLIKEVIRDSISRVPVTDIPATSTENEDTPLNGRTLELSHGDQMQANNCQDDQTHDQTHTHDQTQPCHIQDGHTQAGHNVGNEVDHDNEACIERRRSFMVGLLERVHPVKLVNINMRNQYQLMEMKWDYVASPFPADSSHVEDWDIVPSSFYSEY